MTKKAKSDLLMTKKELELIESGSVANVKVHTPKRLHDYIRLTRKARDKYLDLFQRQVVLKKGSENKRTEDKAKIFSAVLKRYEKRYEATKI